MTRLSFPALRNSLGPALLALLLAAPLSAATVELRALLDLDDNPATGCAVVTVDGPVDGVDQLLTATVETTPSPGQVTGLVRQECDEGTGLFGAALPVDSLQAPPWPVGPGNGVMGSDVVEVYFPLGLVGADLPLRIGLESDDLAGENDALLDLVLDARAGFPEIPTLSTWALLSLALLLASAAFWRLRRRGAVALALLAAGLAAGGVWAVCVLDGEVGDWSGLVPLGTDPVGDAPVDVDIVALFARVDEGDLCLRYDVEINQPPTAVADGFATEEDTPLNVAAPGVLLNDSDFDGDMLTAVLDSGPSNADSFTLNPDGSFSYTPALDFNGSDSFTYHASDGVLDSNTVTVTVTVGPLPDGPMAVDDNFATDEDTVLNFAPPGVLNNDLDPENDPLEVTGFSAMSAQGATVNVAADGSFTYNPTAAANLQALAGGAMLDDTFTYTVEDVPSSGSDVGTVTVTVTGIDDPPTAVNDMATVTEDDPATVIDVLVNDTDPDGGVKQITGVTQPANGTVVNNVTDLTYQPDPDYCNDDGSPTDDFTYTVTGGSMATVSVTVTCVNDPPMVLGETFDVAAGNFDPAIGNTTLHFANAQVLAEPHVFEPGDVLDNDSDIESAPLSVSAVDGDAGAVGSPKVLASGAVVTLEADGEFTYSPPLGFEGLDSFTYTVFDGTDSSTATVNVEIAGMVWYLDNDPANDGTGDDGRAASPFDTIAQFDAENGAGGADDPEAGDTIFIFEGTATYDAGDTDGIDLLDGQKLYGEGVALVVGSSTLVPAGNRPAIDNPNGGGDAVTVLADVTEGNKTGVEIRGLEISGDDNAVVVTSADAAQVGVTISDNLFDASGGAAIDANPGSSGAFDLTVENNSYSTASPTGNGIDVSTAAGNSAAVEVAINGNTDVTSSGGTGINLDGSSGSGTLYVSGFAGNTVHGNTGGAGVMAAAVTFDADPSDGDFDQVAAGTWSVGSSGNPVGTAGVALGTAATNVEGNLSFTQLDVYAGNGTGLTVAGAGVFGSGDPGNGFQLVVGTGTIEATNGPAVDIDPATLNATFASLTSNDSATTGISLTDVAGSFTATTVAIDDTTGAGVAIASSSATVALNGGFIGETTNSATTTGANAVDVDGSSGNVTVAATVTNTAGRSVEVTNHTGGTTLAFSGAIDDDGAGVFLNANGASGGATINFTGGVDLATTINDAFTATGGGTINVADGLVTNVIATSTGTGVNVANTTIGATGVTFDSVSTNGAANGILLASVPSGSFSASGGSITNATSRGLDIAGGTGNVTVGATISTTATGRSVEVTGKMGGTVLVSGAVDDNGLGVNLSSNTGTTMSFTGGLDLDTVGANTAFNATGGGTVNVTGTNTADTTAGTGIGVNIANTTIGASDATFESISASGAANGLVLATTGSTGAFEVTGTGTTDASGGTIQNTTGDAVTANNVRGGLNLSNMVLGDATAVAGQAKDATNNVGGDGIDLVGVDDVVLANMRIARTNNHGIDGTDVTNFAISDSEIFNAGDNDGDSAISFEGVGFNNLDGTATVTNTIVDGPVEFGMRVQNSSGTLGLTISGSQFSGTANTGALMFGEDGLQIEVLGTAQTTARIHGNSVFSMLESDGIMGTTSENGAAVLNITIDGNTFTGFDNGAPNMRSDNAIELNATGGTNAANSPDLRYTINANTINASSNSAILIGANDFTNVDGRITDNVITGSLFGFGIEAPLSADDDSVARLLVTGNTITNHNQQGAFFNANNNGDLDITFTGNAVTTQPTDTTAFENVLFQITSDPPGTLCVEASGNTIALGGADAFGPGVAADALGMIRTGGTAQLEVGSANLADPASTVLTTNNPAAASVFTSGTISVVANGTCLTPIVTPVP